MSARLEKIPCSRCGDELVYPSYHAPVEAMCRPCAASINIDSEDVNIDSWMGRLQRHFHVEREVWGRHCSGKNMRIDAIIRPIDVSEWKNKKIAFGVEFKRDDKESAPILSGEGTKWLAQCCDYAHCDWDRYGHLYILLAGGFNPSAPDGDISRDKELPRLAYHLGVGELKQSTRDGLMIMFSGEHKIWMESTGPYLAKRHGLERKFGSR